MFNFEKQEESVTVFRSQQQKHTTNIDQVFMSLLLRNVAKFRIYSE